MKVSILTIALLFSALASHSQGPFSTDEALKQLFHNYDPVKKTAQWVCAKEQQAEGGERICQYLEGGNVRGNDTVSVTVLLIARVPEGDATRTYFAASAKPARYTGEYDCHACAPVIGVAVYVWQGQHWALESANVTASYSGGWGKPPRVDLVTIGPQKHGLLLSSTDAGSGQVASLKELLAPLGNSVAGVWNLKDEDDDLGAIDPDDKEQGLLAYRVAAAFRFLAGDEAASDKSNYYDIEVISRGSSWGYDHNPLRRENWTEIYTFKDGKYNLLRRTVFAEVKTPRPAPTR